MKFEQAKFHDNYITVTEYRHELHYKKIKCPECEIAPLHYVHKQNAKPHFRSNSRREHDADCQHFREPINQLTIKNLTDSNLPEDQDRLIFLINSGLDAALRILLKRNNPVESNIVKAINSAHPDNNIGNTTNGNTIESIQRFHLTNLKNKEFLLKKYLIVYGKVDIILSDKSFVNKLTKVEFKAGLVFFKVNGELKFSMHLSSNQLVFFQEMGVPPTSNFAVFGQFVKNKNHVNLKIRSTKDFKFSN